MLSRAADNLYWMSRYLERAEHTARLLDVNMQQTLDNTQESAEQYWGLLCAALRTPPTQVGADTAYTMLEALTFDAENGASVLACVAAARENARQVREQISSEMWEQINRFYLRVHRAQAEDLWRTEPHTFFQGVKEGVHQSQGIADSTMSHGEGWRFLQLGRSIERASATALLLDVYFNVFLSQPEAAADGDVEQTQVATIEPDWVGLLKCCTAFEAYCKVYTATLRPRSIVEFLLLNAEFPRSVRFTTDAIQGALQAIARTTGQRSAGRVERLAGRLRATLDYAQVDEILDDNLHSYLDGVQKQLSRIHTTLYEVFMEYPITGALTL